MKHALIQNLPTENNQVAIQLEECADLMEAGKSRPATVQALRHGATNIRQHPVPVSEVYSKGGRPGLVAMPGVGDFIAGLVIEYIVSHRISLNDRLRCSVPTEKILEGLPAVGEKKARLLARGYGIKDLHQLEKALQNGDLDPVFAPGSDGRNRVTRDLQHRLHTIRGAQDGGPLPPLTDILEADRIFRQRWNKDRSLPIPLQLTVNHRSFRAAPAATTGQGPEYSSDDPTLIWCLRSRFNRPFRVFTGRYGNLRGKRVVAGYLAEMRRMHRLPGRQQEFWSHMKASLGRPEPGGRFP